MEGSAGPRWVSSILGALLFVSACTSSPTPGESPVPRLSPVYEPVSCSKPYVVSTPSTAENYSGALFTQVDATGIHFVKSYCPASAGGLAASGRAVALGDGAVALGDYDNDGDLDLFFVQGGPDVLYRNDGNWHFTEVTAAAGVGDRGEGHAAAWGDYDNDGCLDLYVGNMRSPNALYRNNCDGAFTDVARSAGVGHSGFTFHVAWGDFNRDGCLDLYLANYVDPRDLYAEARDFSYSFNARNGEPNLLYRNNCDGSFADVTNLTGTGDTGQSFAAAFTDLNRDRWPDLFVANDFGPNTLYLNNRNGTFRDETPGSGAGYRANGMGVDSGDYDNDGDLDVYVPNILWVQYLGNALRLPPGTDGERLEGIRTLLRDPGSPELRKVPPIARGSLPLMAAMESFLGRNSGGADPVFEDAGKSAGVHRVEWGWGGVFLDADSDGWLDLYVANGMDQFAREFQRLPNRFFRNLGNGSFEDATSRAGGGDRGNSRGVAYGDLDLDGDLDLVVVNYLGPARLYRNDAASPGHWLIVKPVGACGPDHRGNASPANCSNRDGIGAWVALKAGNLSLLREVKSGSGFASNSMIPVHFGLGTADFASDLEVRWPSGKVTRLVDVKADQILTVQEPG